jgi:ATP-dependent protease HslVU (ClpYQ) peptidase subunit
MTTIVAVEDHGRVHIGSDTQVTAGFSKTSLAGGKINTVGEYTFGLAGLFELIERLKRTEWPSVEGDVEAHVHDTLIPWLLEQQSAMFTDFGIDENSDNPFQRVPRSTVLLALRGKVYEISLEKGISPLHKGDGRYAIGSGTSYALGSLGSAKKNDRRAVLNALEAASKNDLGTSGPFVVKTVR